MAATIHVFNGRQNGSFRAVVLRYRSSLERDVATGYCGPASKVYYKVWQALSKQDQKQTRCLPVRDTRHCSHASLHDATTAALFVHNPETQSAYTDASISMTVRAGVITNQAIKIHWAKQ